MEDLTLLTHPPVAFSFLFLNCMYVIYMYEMHMYSFKNNHNENTVESGLRQRNRHCQYMRGSLCVPHNCLSITPSPYHLPSRGNHYPDIYSYASV